MTQEQIIEGNKLIAEFLELRKTFVQIRNQNDSLRNAEPEWCMYGVDEYKDTFKDSELKFHSSWDWLIPVAEKCLTTNHEGNLHMILNDALLTLNRTEVWNAVVEFIKWYNKKK